MPPYYNTANLYNIMPTPIAELGLILIIGILQPITEMLLGSQIATYYNGIAILIVVAYTMVRIFSSSKVIWAKWSIRIDTLKGSILPYTLFCVVATLGLYGYGYLVGNTPLPTGFWYVLGIYPLWGFAQQFVLQNFIAENLAASIPSPLYRSIVTASIFACAHIPSIALFILTLVAGFIFTYMHTKYHNLLSLSVAHGILGALAFHLVLGQNQWEILVQYFS